MESGLSRSAKKIQETLNAHGVKTEVIELPTSTRTSAEAAAAIGCTVAQIAKSIVFRATETGRAILVVASGSNRIDEATISSVIGEPIAKANANFVREKTGFVIGGVPPIGHPVALYTLIDEDLFSLGDIWAAAGTPNSVFRFNAEVLVQLTQGTVLAIK